MLKESRRALSLEALARHEQRIHAMVQKIEQYRPTFHINPNYNGCDTANRSRDRQTRNDLLFQQNINLIHRLETTGPRIETKKFPEVRPNPRRLKTLSVTRSRSSSKDKPAGEGATLQEENLRLIVSIECTGPKIQCWTTRKLRHLSDLKKQRKRDEDMKIRQKFQQISCQLARLTAHPRLPHPPHHPVPAAEQAVPTGAGGA